MKYAFLVFAAIFFLGIVVFLVLTFRPNKEGTLQTAVVEIRGHRWTAEIAETALEKARGLSGRTDLSTDKGMLFYFSPASRQSFWMKGMNFPLDLIWIRDSKIVEITKNAPPLKDALRPLYYTPGEPVDTVLEINAGLADQFRLQAGDSVTIRR